MLSHGESFIHTARPVLDQQVKLGMVASTSSWEGQGIHRAWITEGPRKDAGSWSPWLKGDHQSAIACLAGGTAWARVPTGTVRLWPCRPALQVLRAGNTQGKGSSGNQIRFWGLRKGSKGKSLFLTIPDINQNSSKEESRVGWI